MASLITEQGDLGLGVSNMSPEDQKLYEKQQREEAASKNSETEAE